MSNAPSALEIETIDHDYGPTRELLHAMKAGTNDAGPQAVVGQLLPHRLVSSPVSLFPSQP